jgi:dihydrofolate synthase/folylpolyglutamate synthase
LNNASRLQRYFDAVQATDALIESAYAPGDSSLSAVMKRATHRMGRVRSLMHDLGDPLAGIPLVHIGGTSGKGSTSTFLHSILHSAGIRSGLHTSPYLQVATEKLHLGQRLIDPDHFADLVDEILGVARSWSERHGERLTYGEIWIGLIGCFFRDHNVKIGVIEVGAGGRFDLTNVIDPILSVITSVGLDHIQTLGDSISQIAWHKAGILKPGVPAITAVDDPVALEIIEAEAAHTNSALTRVIEGETWSVESLTSIGVTWRDHTSDTNFSTSLPGRFQAANGATAAAAARALRAAGFDIPEGAIAAGLAKARIPGRAEVMQEQPRVLLDGAHNPQKVGAFSRDLATLLPIGPDGKRIAVLGMLDAKAHGESIGELLPHIDVLITTSPNVTAKAGLAAERLAEVARELGYTGEIRREAEPRDALKLALQLATPADAVFVTGSLYLIGNLRGHWQPDDEIILNRSQWPRERP